jgi:hypothetical protein
MTGAEAPFSVGDISSMFMCALVLVGQAATMAKNRRDDQASMKKRVADRATSEATEAATVKSLSESFDRMSASITELAKLYRTHELECSSWRSAMETKYGAIIKTQTEMLRNMENYGRQMTNLAVQLAPGPAIELSANRRR